MSDLRICDQESCAAEFALDHAEPTVEEVIEWLNARHTQWVFHLDTHLLKVRRVVSDE